ncbi:hypothetical protein OCGS_1590 [Oceaniovalibus guishaninsula JLT2003]|uniref:Probable membrane transporter protein n=1 Tax=Oceaniovalibus guishaninsula JLT2003 TaxID=1231392 RepID=K2HMJ8_9RHOB|nr:sulfite exporter TauE/SafE family protein [Oceaniovalibus guishaninsula]EKE44074.1 hypothetical protein OCGS_1590 [Oceaniovalibus guishaninsula JLT2003]
MDHLLTLLPLPLLIFAIAVTLMAGFIKGAVGFAMPLVMISGMSILIEPRLVVAGVVLPIVMSNALQTARAGWAEAKASLIDFRRYILIVCLCIFATAQFVTMIPARAMYVVLGVPTFALSMIQLAGVTFRVPPDKRVRFDLLVGGLAGTLGGLAGTWGPPTVLYLLALNTPKARQLAAQGVVYGLGSVTLLAGHLQSGILNRATIPFSAMLLIPAAMGMWAGFWVSDRMDQARFRRATLVVLAVAGLNLIRKGVMG